jgi:hypothetical protein
MAKAKVNRCVWMAAVLVAISLAVTISSVVAYDKAYAGQYKGNQAYSDTNSCGNEDMPMNVQCSNSNSGVYGKDNASALATAQGRPLISEVPDKIFDGFLTIKEAFIKTFGKLNPPIGNERGGLDAFLKTHGLIPQNGEGGAFGYGIITTNTETGDGSLTVATTHAGVLDSAEQRNIRDPVWHNHVVKLALPPSPPGSDPDYPCGTDPSVAQITWKQPGDVLIKGKTAQLTNIPNVFSSPSSFDPNGDDETYEPGNRVQTVVSFKLAPVPENGGSAPDGTLDAVCVTDITPVPEENLIIK